MTYTVSRKDGGQETMLSQINATLYSSGPFKQLLNNSLDKTVLVTMRKG